MIRRLLECDEVQVGIAGAIALAILLAGAHWLGPTEPSEADAPANDVRTLQELLPPKTHWYTAAFDE